MPSWWDGRAITTFLWQYHFSAGVSHRNGPRPAICGNPHPDNLVALRVQGDGFGHRLFFGFPCAGNHGVSGSRQRLNVSLNLCVHLLRKIRVVGQNPNCLHVKRKRPIVDYYVD